MNLTTYVEENPLHAGWRYFNPEQAVHFCQMLQAEGRFRDVFVIPKESPAFADLRPYVLTIDVDPFNILDWRHGSAGEIMEERILGIFADDLHKMLSAASYLLIDINITVRRHARIRHAETFALSFRALGLMGV